MLFMMFVISRNQISIYRIEKLKHMANELDTTFKDTTITSLLSKTMCK